MPHGPWALRVPKEAKFRQTSSKQLWHSLENLSGQEDSIEQKQESGIIPLTVSRGLWLPSLTCDVSAPSAPQTGIF